MWTHICAKSSKRVRERGRTWAELVALYFGEGKEHRYLKCSRLCPVVFLIVLEEMWRRYNYLNVLIF
jgi:hypothetical protein